ncbi:ROK family transcriptional regulator [Nonomuraea sp. NPDC046570]|uniref:ROK family transcriptional regulator n=1 Tax=Nonomuraea sp. NPDC046570 TaxID=3155255 RepID=UPI0033CA1BB4
MTRAVRHDAMRARNMALVLGEVSRNGQATRAELAGRTGLTKTTVSRLVGDLISAGIAVESEARYGERGRPGVPVAVSGHRHAALGLEINVDHLSVCVVDLARTVRHRRTLPGDNRGSDPAEVMTRLRAMAVEAVERTGLTIAGGVLAVPGPAVPADGLVRSAPNLGWHEVQPVELLGLPFPVSVDNEANLAALGELWFGSGVRDFLFVSGEVGIGAGLVVNGELFRGARGFAGELGHMVVRPDGPLCRCGGRGCLERYTGAEALLGDARTVPELIARLADPANDGASGETDGSAKPLDDVSRVEEAGTALGVALASAVHLVDPGAIVLGGIFTPLFPWIHAPVETALQERLGGLTGGPPPLTISTAGPDAAVLGAAGQVLQRVIADPAALITLTTPRDPAPR